MNMRLGFAIAANLNPDILLLDEIFAVGDQDFQQRCMRTMERFASEGRTLLFVSHAPSSVRAICRRVCVLDQGRLVFDGGVEEGLAHYDRMINHTERCQGVVHTALELRPAAAVDAVPHWQDRTDEWALELLRHEGLQPGHRVLEITCGVAADSSCLAGYVGRERYQHWDIMQPLAEPLRGFDYAIASPLLSRISLNAAARCLAIVLRVMDGGGRLYASWIEHEDPIAVSDVPPFEYPFGLVAGIGQALGLRAARVTGAAHPAGEAVLVFELA
jgi:hypothetical protein